MTTMSKRAEHLHLTMRADEAYIAQRKPEAMERFLGQLAEEPGDLYCWYITSVLLGRMGDRDSARENLSAVSVALARAGYPLLGLAACRDLARFDSQQSRAQVEAIARMYGAGSTQLRPRRRSLPPPMLDADDGPDAEPLEVSADNAALLQRAREACQVASAAWQERRAHLDEEKLPFQPLLSDLEPDDFTAAAGLLELRLFPAGETIIEQGTVGKSFYMVVRGGVSVDRRLPGGAEGHLAHQGAGAFFGEMALLTATPRAARVSCLYPTLIFELERVAVERLAARCPGFARVLASYTRERLLQNLLSTSPLFQPLDPTRREQLRGLFRSRVAEPEEVVLAEGESSAGLHVVLSGEVRVSRSEGEEELTLADLGPGQFFGEMSMIQNKPATATVTALSRTALLVLSREDFNAHVCHFPEVLAHVYSVAVERERTNLVVDQSPITQVSEENLLI